MTAIKIIISSAGETLMPDSQFTPLVYLDTLSGVKVTNSLVVIGPTPL